MQENRAEKRRYGILLALVAATILIVGLLVKPQDTLRQLPQDAKVEAVRADLNSLRELAQRSTLRNTSSRFAAMASADAAFVLETDRDQSSVVWSERGLVISADLRPLAGLHILVPRSKLAATPKTWGAGLPFTLYQARALNVSPPEVLATEDIQPGTWTLVDTIGPQGPEFVSGMYSGIGKTTCEGIDYDKVLLNAPFDPHFVGSGMFDTDGNLIAVLAPCDHEIAAIPVAEIASHLADLSRPEQQPFAHLGFVVKPIAAPLAALLPGSNGLVVTDVWSDWAAGLAGLLPGDVLLTVNNAPASSVAQVAAALNSTPVQVKVQRTPHTILTLTLDADAPPAPVQIQTPSEGVVVSTLSGASTKRLGIRSGDRILSIAGHPATDRSVLQLFGSPAPAPTLLTVQRGPRRFLVAVPD